MEGRHATVSVDLGDLTYSQLGPKDTKKNVNTTEIRFDPSTLHEKADDFDLGDPPGLGRQRSKSQGHHRERRNQNSFDSFSFNLDEEFAELENSYIETTSAVRKTTRFSDVRDNLEGLNLESSRNFPEYDILADTLENSGIDDVRAVGGRKWASSFHGFEGDSDSLFKDLERPITPRASLDYSMLEESSLSSFPTGRRRESPVSNISGNPTSQLQQVQNRPVNVKLQGIMQRERAESDMGRYPSTFLRKDAEQQQHQNQDADIVNENLGRMMSPLGMSETKVQDISSAHTQSPERSTNGVDSVLHDEQFKQDNGVSYNNHRYNNNGMRKSPNHFQSHQKGRSAAGTNKGDWICVVCGNNNYSWRHVCNMRKCRAPKPGHLTMNPSPPGSWACLSCGNLNYAERMVCNMRKCRAPRPLNSELLAGVGNLNGVSSPYNIGRYGIQQMGGYASFIPQSISPMGSMNYNSQNGAMSEQYWENNSKQEGMKNSRSIPVQANGMSPKLQYLNAAQTDSHEATTSGANLSQGYNLEEHMQNGLKLVHN